MSEKEITEYKAAIKQLKEKLSGNKEASRDFLVRAGIITPKGNLRKPFKHLPLCIPKELA